MEIPTIKFSVSKPVLTQVPTNPDGTVVEIKTGDVFTQVDSNGNISMIMKTEEGYVSNTELAESEELNGTEN